MSVFLGSAIVVGLIWLMIFFMEKAFLCESLLNVWSISAFAVTSFFLGLIMYASSEDEANGPCIQYETQMYWNAGAKTMMPARSCTMRAEWVKP